MAIHLEVPMADIYIFKRIEKKYRLTDEKKALLMSRISDRLIPDVHGVSTVCNLYLDTPSFLLIRNSAYFLNLANCLN